MMITFLLPEILLLTFDAANKRNLKYTKKMFIGFFFVNAVMLPIICLMGFVPETLYDWIVSGS